MSEQKTLTTLDRTEATVLQSFISQVDYWQTVYGERADKIEIVYYPEDDGFEVTNNEPNNGLLKRNRVTAFRADILAWGANQIKTLKGWDNSKTVTAFDLLYADGEFGVRVKVVNADEFGKTADISEQS